MAHYLIYIPGATEGDDNILDEVGLGPLRNSGLCTFWQAVMQNGPDGGAGMICTWMSGDPIRDGTPSEFQIYNWTPAPGFTGLKEGRFWVGVHPVGMQPHDIQLPKRYTGHEVLCADENKWHIPTTTRLPHQHGMNQDGVWERKIAKQYHSFASRSCEYAQAIFDKHDAVEVLLAAMPDVPETQKIAEIELSGADTHCCEALMLNYRLCPELIDMFGILNDDAMIGIISATIDLPDIHAALTQKKTYSPVGIPVT